MALPYGGTIIECTEKLELLIYRSLGMYLEIFVSFISFISLLVNSLLTI